METKNLVATVYLKDGKAVRSMNDFTEIENVYQLCQMYNDSGIDKIVILDLSTSDEEHEKNIHTIRNINRNIEIKVCAGGNINRIEDIKKLFFAGCMQVMLNAAKPSSIGLAEEASQRFGKDRIVLSVHNVDFIFKHRSDIEETFHELYILDTKILDAIDNLSEIPYVVMTDTDDYQEILDLLSRQNIRGVTGAMINRATTDIMKLKSELSADGIIMDNFAPDLQWGDLKPNEDGLVPVIVQDYRTNQVLMLAYMNEEAFHTTIHIGKMTYYNCKKERAVMKGHRSGCYQYVKSLTADCDCDTILAKVSQVGDACHTGGATCFINNIVKKEYVDKNPLTILERVYDIIKDRKKNPQEGSYTNELFDKGLDEILKKIGQENIEIVIAAKNTEPEAVVYEISDLLYHCMVLMVEKEITWEEITQELSQR